MFALASLSHLEKIASEHDAESRSQASAVTGKGDETVHMAQSPAREPDGQQEPDEDEVDVDTDRIHFMSLEEGRQLFDKQARKYLNMTGEEFRRQYRAGLLDCEQPEVIRVSFLLPFAEFPEDDQTE